MKMFRILRRFYVGSITEMPNKRDRHEEHRQKEYVSVWVVLLLTTQFVHLILHFNLFIYLKEFAILWSQIDDINTMQYNTIQYNTITINISEPSSEIYMKN